MKITLPPAEQNGLYAVPVDVAPLRRAARDAGLTWHVVDLQRARGKRALFTAFAREFAFPATFGGNWDALADCLQDLSWQTAPGRIVLMRGAGVFATASPDDYSTLCEILAATAEFWSGRKKLFVVLADDAVGRSVWSR
jgi:RNAse (barnase) inhibitor barstar